MFKLQEIFPETHTALQKAIIVLLALVAFFLPFKFLVSVFIGLILVAWVLGNPFKKLFTKNANTKIFLTAIIFYLLHAAALLYTKNIHEGLFSLEIKLSLPIFALIFYTEQFTEKQIVFFIKSFILGTLLCCLICLTRSVFLYVSTGQNYFYYEGIAWFQHPSYLTMYITFCCVALLLQNYFNKALSYLCVAFFTVFVLLLTSKTGIAIHFCALVFCITSQFFNRKNYIKVIGVAALAVLIFCICLKYVPALNRYNGAFAAMQSTNLDKTSTESTTVRRLIWGEAWQISKDHLLLGVSPGDANDALYSSYEQHGITGAYAKKLNAHSQYFQTMVSLGLVGLCSLLALFIVPLVENQKKMVLFFVLITALNFLTESMLQTMAGSIFLGYFYSVICFKHDSVFAPKN